jgi:excisionase family DNA binding protein
VFALGGSELADPSVVALLERLGYVRVEIEQPGESRRLALPPGTPPEGADVTPRADGFPIVRAGNTSDRVARAGDDEPLLDAGEVAALLHVKERWVRDATRDGRLPHIRLGRYVRYARGDVGAWIEAQKQPIQSRQYQKAVPSER